MKNHRQLVVLFLHLLLVLPLQLEANEEASSDEVVLLEAFVTSEAGRFPQDTVLAHNFPTPGVFEDNTNAFEVPRSVSVLTPRLQRDLSIDDLGELAKFGAGTQRPNYFGVAGAPFIRGDLASIYFNGMQRHFQINAMPISFNSFDGMVIVKGPAPAHFGPTQAGGFVNQIPKQPYYESFNGSLQLKMGNNNYRQLHWDMGNAYLLGKTPAAYRFSLKIQNDDTDFNNLRNDYVSVYGALKTKLSDKLTSFTGFEYYDYKSNENAGWNRVTQALIDSSRYLVGEPRNQTSSRFDNNVNRDIFEWGFTPPVDNFYALVVPSDAVLSRYGDHESALAAGLEDLTDTDGGYAYTESFFNQGGEVFTTKLLDQQVLSDSGDKLNAQNFLGFMDFIYQVSPDQVIKNQTLIEYVDTEKYSSYGFSFDARQKLLENKTTVSRSIDAGLINHLTYGVSLRYSEVEQLVDFDAEPFARRDLSRDTISGNSKVFSGADQPLSGDTANYWSWFNGVSSSNDLIQGGLFTTLSARWTEKLNSILAMRYEYNAFDAALSDKVERVPPGVRESLKISGNKNLYSLGINTSWRINEQFHLYTTLQQGTVLNPGDGGSVRSQENFAKSRLYEIGSKAKLLNNTLYVDTSIYRWRKSKFLSREGGAIEFQAEGYELEMSWMPGNIGYLIFSVNHQRVHRLEGLGFRTLPTSEQDLALNGGLLIAGVQDPVDNPNLIVPGWPETTVKIFGVVPAGENWEFGLGAQWAEAFFLSYDHSVKLPEATVLNGFIKYDAANWAISLEMDNISDESYFLGGDPEFGANASVTRAAGREYRLVLRRKF